MPEEQPAEEGGIVKADGRGDGIDAFARFQQDLLGTLHSNFLQCGRNAFSLFPPENSLQVSRAYHELFGQVFRCNSLIKIFARDKCKHSSQESRIRPLAALATAPTARFDFECSERAESAT